MDSTFETVAARAAPHFDARANSMSDDERSSDDEGEREDLYALLGLSKDDNPSSDDIKRAYRKMALKLHPDKNVGDARAPERFQQLQRVYGILSDPDKRAAYDKTGCAEDAELASEEFRTLYEYYRSVYKEVTKEDVETFEKEYRGSDEERRDVLEYYVKYEGDMTRVFAWVMCSEESEDSHRFADLVDAAIAAKEVKSHATYQAWAKEIRKRKAPKDPLGSRREKKSGKSKSGQDDGDLFALIQRRKDMRAEQADAMFADLEARYAPKKKTKK